MVEEIKNKILKTLQDMDISKFTLEELNQYTNVFEVCANISQKEYLNSLINIFGKDVELSKSSQLPCLSAEQSREIKESEAE